MTHLKGSVDLADRISRSPGYKAALSACHDSLLTFCQYALAPNIKGANVYTSTDSETEIHNQKYSVNPNRHSCHYICICLRIQKKLNCFFTFVHFPFNEKEICVVSRTLIELHVRLFTAQPSSGGCSQ